jgi:hypothetical protein
MDLCLAGNILGNAGFKNAGLIGDAMERKIRASNFIETAFAFPVDQTIGT